MEASCVRVERVRGEEARRALADLDLVADDLRIAVEDGWLYIPVVDPTAVPPGFAVVTHDVPARERQQMPADLLGYEPSYERLGDIVILDDDDPERAREIADAIVASALPVRTVVNRASKIKGELRVRDWDVLVDEIDESNSSGSETASRPHTETVHREYGCEFALDIAQVYFSPRLATERHRVCSQVADGERFLDMFAGVGPFAIPAAKRGATVVAADLNEVAVGYLRENARHNGVEERVTAIHGDVRELANEYEGWADRLVMNLPHSADEFLDTAVALAGDDCVLHYYDIQHEDDQYGPAERAIRAAAGDEYDVTVETRHAVRSYAPHELNVCLDVRLSRTTE